MEEADRAARAGAAHGTVITADEQTRGRGRRGRTWSSIPGAGLSLSVVLRPPVALADVPPITLAAGVAVCDAVNSLGVEASIKWPNDVVVAGKKMAGILTEMSSSSMKLEHVVLGIGVNVSAVPVDVADVGISLDQALGRPSTLATVYVALVAELSTWLTRFFEHGLDAIAPACRQRAWLGARVTSSSPPLAGWARDIGDDGALIVEDDVGNRHSIVAGELTWSMKRS